MQNPQQFERQMQQEIQQIWQKYTAKDVEAMHTCFQEEDLTRFDNCIQGVTER